jgi:hypothetical protein
VLIAVLHWLSHITGCDYGLPYGHFSWYNLYSGFAPDIVMPLAVLAWFYHHTCQAHRACFRWGKYPAAGNLFRTCHRHHPDLKGERPHHELIARLHEQHKNKMTV